MQEIPNFKTANLKQCTYLCLLDSKCSFKPLIRARQNLETQKHALANTENIITLLLYLAYFKSK